MKTKSELKPGEFRLHCGACSHPIKRDYASFWCVNKHCPQAETRLPIGKNVFVNQFVERERA